MGNARADVLFDCIKIKRKNGNPRANDAISQDYQVIFTIDEEEDELNQTPSIKWGLKM